VMWMVVGSMVGGRRWDGGMMANGGGDEVVGSCTEVDVDVEVGDGDVGADVDGRGVNGRRKAVGRWHDGERRR
jgi:hypothetical protein